MKIRATEMGRDTFELDIDLSESDAYLIAAAAHTLSPARHTGGDVSPSTIVDEWRKVKGGLSTQRDQPESESRKRS